MNIGLIPLKNAETEILRELLNDTSVTNHMPLAEPVTTQWVEEWKNQKSRLWDDPELGPWAVYIDDRFAGWAGLQPDGPNQAELAVVLKVWAWGLGKDVTRAVLAKWRSYGRTENLVIYLPESRPLELLQKRFSWELVGYQEFNGVRFAQFRIDDF